MVLEKQLGNGCTWIDLDVDKIKNMEDLPEAIKNEMQKDDMIITMGAGNIYRVGEDLIMSRKERDND